MHTLVCKICGKPFKGRFPNQTVCEPCKNRPCEICGKPFKRVDPYDQKYCSKECRSIAKKDPERNKEWTAKRVATCEDRYGVSNVTYLEESKAKAAEAKTATKKKNLIQKQILQEQERIAKAAEKERVKQEKEKARLRAKLRICKDCGKLFMPTSSRNYYCHRDHYRTCKVCGQEYLVKYADLPYPRNVCYNTECTNKWRIQRNIEIYGCKDPGNSPENIEKRRQTNLERYGVDNPFKSEEIKAKIIDTNMEKYGVPYAVQSPEVIAKQKQAMIDNWGKGMPELVKKRSETCLKKYGVSNPGKVPEIREKAKQTNIERYGCENPGFEKMQSVISKHKAMLNRVSETNKEYKERLDKLGWDTQFEFNIETRWYDLYTLGHPILVEIDPTYTHYTDGKPFVDSIEPTDKMQHLEKSKLAEKYGYHCFHIFDWDDKYKVLQCLRRDRETIYARKCKVVEIDNETACNFENVYHMQGAVKNQVICLGLDYDGDLVQVMTFGKPRYNRNYQWELLRLCTKYDYRITGGASKLFKYFINIYDPTSILSYCDRAKFSGEVYNNMGMRLHHVTDPARTWSKGTKKITDNLLRQRGYDQLFGTNYGKGTSNQDLMIENGWHSVYDCGQLVFEWKR